MSNYYKFIKPNINEYYNELFKTLYFKKYMLIVNHTIDKEIYVFRYGLKKD